MGLDILFQQLLFGLFVGALYGIAAVGLSLVFGVLRVLNVAHGELLMLGGYVSFFLFSLLGLDPFLSLLVCAPVMFLAGVALHLGLFRLVTRLDEEARIKGSLLISFELTLVLHNLAIQLFTADERTISLSYAGSAIVGGLVFPYVRVAGLLVALAVIALLDLVLRRTYLGKAIRATAVDWEAASLAGIDVQRAYLIAFALGTALAGVAGTLVAVGYSVTPSIGLAWTLKSMVVVVLAGLGSTLGAFVAGLLLGVVEAGSVTVIGAGYREVVGLVMFLAVLLIRPQGLFGRR
ncbi:MAG: branched-chain amino acid ABC transporter permease [Chloroflexota bacterium]